MPACPEARPGLQVTRGFVQRLGGARKRATMLDRICVVGCWLLFLCSSVA